MSLIGKLVNKLLKQGSLTLIGPSGKRETCGPGGGKHLTVRFTDSRVGFEIVKNPRLGQWTLQIDQEKKYRRAPERGAIKVIIRVQRVFTSPR